MSPERPRKPVTVADVARVIEDFAPPGLALAGDSIGLQVGGLTRPAERVMLTVDVPGGLPAYAGGRRAQLVISHHPLFYRPLERVTEDDWRSRIVKDLLARGIGLYSAHTNLDCCRGGTGDALAALAGLKETEPLAGAAPGEQLKLVVFVPPAHLEAVEDALYSRGAGVIGEYTGCGFRAPGRGTFIPTGKARPFIGRPGKREEVEETRLEVLLPGARAGEAIRGLLKAHPYEEPAFDLYPLKDPGRRHGLGRRGELDRPVKGPDLLRRLARKLGPGGRFFGDSRRRARVLGVAPGAGRGVAAAAAAAGCELFLTGELGHHEIQDLTERGLGVITLGHEPSERPVLAVLAKLLAEKLPGIKIVGE